MSETRIPEGRVKKGGGNPRVTMPRPQRPGPVPREAEGAEPMRLPADEDGGFVVPISRERLEELGYKPKPEWSPSLPWRVRLRVLLKAWPHGLALIKIEKLHERIRRWRM